MVKAGLAGRYSAEKNRRIRPWLLTEAMQTAGISDLVACGKGRILFIEVKTEKGTQTPAQIVFQNEVEANGGTYLLWRSTKDAWDFLVSVGLLSESPGAP